MKKTLKTINQYRFILVVTVTLLVLLYLNQEHVPASGITQDDFPQPSPMINSDTNPDHRHA